MNISKRKARLFDALSLVFAALAIAWLALPSSVFLKPEAIIYDGRIVTLQRQTPLGSVTSTWDRELYVVGTHLECHAPTSLAQHQRVSGRVDPETGETVAENTVTWIEGDWALPCLMAEPPIIATHTWQVRLFGLIPLRPVRLVATIDKAMPGAAQCDDIRATASGIYHTRESPWYDQITNVRRCFQTVEDAEAAGYRPPSPLSLQLFKEEE